MQSLAMGQEGFDSRQKRERGFHKNMQYYGKDCNAAVLCIQAMGTQIFQNASLACTSVEFYRKCPNYKIFCDSITVL